MELFLRLFLHLLWDTLVLFVLLRVALLKPLPRWHNLGSVSLAIATWKCLLYFLLGVFSFVPLLLSTGLFLHWTYRLSIRTTVYILAIFVVAGIFFGSILFAAYGVLELFFI